MEKIPVTVVVITKNEADNIAACLESAQCASEIIVVDDQSTDNTVAIAKRFTDNVVTRRMDNEGAHRNYAYSLAKNKWVLSLDADERMSSELAQELRQLFTTTFSHIVFSIPIKTYIGKRWIRYGGWYPAHKARLFDKEKVKYEEALVHPRIIYHGTCGKLSGDIVHYSYRDLHDFFQSLNNQTTLEAKKWFGEKRRIGFLKMYRKFLDRFLKSYLIQQGFKDGLLGFVIGYANGLYQFMSYVKYREMVENDNSTHAQEKERRS